MTEEDEIRALIPNIDPRSVPGMAEVCRVLRSKQGAAAGELMAGRMTKQEYVAELERILAEAKSAGERTIGADAFHKAFGDFTVDSLVDIDLFMANDPAH